MEFAQDLVPPVPYFPEFKRIVVVIALYCSDSRNVSKNYYAAKEKVLSEMEQNGTIVEFEKLNDPGVFMTQVTAEKIMGMIRTREKAYRNYIGKGIMPEYHVHVFSHGNVKISGEFDGLPFLPENLVVKEGCPTNCGMMHAHTAIKSFQDHILEQQPAFAFNGKMVKITEERLLREFMVQHFNGQDTPNGWDGNLLSWLEPVKDIRTHPAKQIRILEKKMASDEGFKDIADRVKTFAQVLNYETREIFRVDGKVRQEDEVLAKIFESERVMGGSIDFERLTTPQAELGVRLVLSGTAPNTRQLLAKVKNKDGVGGRFFSVAGPTDFKFFNPYADIGFHYASSQDFLNKRNRETMYVVVRSNTELFNIFGKIARDPLASFALSQFSRRMCIMKNDSGMPKKLFLRA
jgi:hypothetical protein